MFTARIFCCTSLVRPYFERFHKRDRICDVILPLFAYLFSVGYLTQILIQLDPCCQSDIKLSRVAFAEPIAENRYNLQLLERTKRQ